MIVIESIPDEIEIPLGTRLKRFEGAVAVVRALELEEHAAITDAFGKGGVQTAALACVRQRLVRINGLSIMDQYGKTEPFDKNKPLHWGQLPFELVDHIFAKLYGYRDSEERRVTTVPDNG